LVEANSGRSSGACTLGSGGNLAPILYSCDINGTTIPCLTSP
jgi:hypothetical protein